MKKYLTILSLFVLTSCHHMMSQNVNVNPSVSFQETKLKTNNGAKVTVFDKRLNSFVIGKRWYLLGGSITTYQNLKDVIASKVMSGLKKNGLKAGEDWVIEVKLNSLTYRTEMGAFTIDSVAECQMSATVKDKKGVSKYSDNYQAQVRNTHIIAPFASTNEEYINEAIAKTIGKLLEDEG